MAGRIRNTNSKKLNFWNVGIYCRLSSEDGDNAESDSITNQKELINYYLKNESNVRIIDYYTDDGISGTSFNRTEFKRMFNDIVNGKINSVVVKDLSRFGRNYIDVGNYIEQIFPLYNIRFIAINDNIDSFKDPKSLNNIIVPFKNLMNDEYARDISNKVKSVLISKSLNGEWVGGTTPYGYTKDPNNIHQLIIDNEESSNVKDIYNRFLKGEGLIRICKYFNNNGILCRKEIQRRKKHNLSMNVNDEKCVYQWSKSTIGKILTSEIYIGHLVYNKTGSISYKNHKQISKPKSEWIVVKNTHEPIIDETTFKRIQQLFKEKNINRKESVSLSIYRYKLKCADCGKGMCKMDDFRKNKHYSNYYCRNYKTTSNICSPHKIKTADLDNAVLETIKMQINTVVNLSKMIKELNEKSLVNSNKQEYSKKINRINNDIEKIKRLKKISYEDWKFEKITKDEFLYYSKDYEERISLLNNEMRVAEKIYFESIKKYKKDDYWIEHFRRNKQIKMLSKEVIDELIETIYVHEGGTITIKFKYQDEYERTLEYLKAKEVMKT